MGFDLWYELRLLEIARVDDVTGALERETTPQSAYESSDEEDED